MRRAFEALGLFLASMAFGAAVVWGFYLITEILRRA